MNSDKIPSLKTRKNRRGELLAAIAALQLASVDANAELRMPTPKPSPGHSVLLEKEAAASKGRKPKSFHVQPKIPSAKDADHISGFLALSEKMRGKQLQLQGAEIPLPQYEAFCKELSIFCERFAGYRDDVRYDESFTPELFARIAGIQYDVNRKIKPVTDIEKYGIVEKWTIPDDSGDCEDYALLKMLRYIDAGINPATLHLLVVIDEKGEGHAVLGLDVFHKGVRNTLILDNKHNDVITLDTMEKKYRGISASFLVREQDGKLSVRFYDYRSTIGKAELQR